jgi:hypothetical protein
LGVKRDIALGMAAKERKYKWKERKNEREIDRQ